MKRDAADRAFSDFIRERDNFECQRCNRVFPEGQRQGLDCSHFYSRRHQSTRFLSTNAAAHCRGCHQFLTGNPLSFSDWIRDFLGDEECESLRIRHNKTQKRTKGEKKEIAQHWRSQLKYMQRCRKDGREFNVCEWD